VRQRCVLFYVQSRRLHPGLLSFPTRRSSDLKIYHHQNNPFDDYVEYAKTRSKGKTILGLILSISGKSEAQNWLGISYQQLVNAVRPYLAEQMMTNPMNKWNLFAREFLLHLESYYRIQNLDMNRIQFIFDHYQEIQEL